MGESGGTGCNLTLSSWGGCSSLSLSGNGDLGLWRAVPRRVSPDWRPGHLAGSLALAPPGWSIACLPSMWQSINKGGGWQARAGGALRAMAGGCPTLQPTAVWASLGALNPSSLGWLSGWLPRQGGGPRLNSCLDNHHRSKGTPPGEEHNPCLGGRPG